MLQRIDEELEERMNDSFEKRYSQQQICHTKRQKCADSDACSYFVCGGGSSGSSSSESDSDFLDDGSGGRDDDSDSDLDPRSAVTVTRQLCSASGSSCEQAQEEVASAGPDSRRQAGATR